MSDELDVLKEMRDTSPEMERQFVEMMMRRSGQERLKMGFSMFNMARRQVVASIKMSKPDADGKEIRKEKTYSFDFTVRISLLRLRKKFSGRSKGYPRNPNSDIK